MPVPTACIVVKGIVWYNINYSIDSFYMHIVVNVMAKYSCVPMYSDNGHCIFVLGGDRWMIHKPTE